MNNGRHRNFCLVCRDHKKIRIIQRTAPDIDGGVHYVGKITFELTTAEEIWEKTIIIQSPNAMAARGLKIIDVLKFPTKFQITQEYRQNYIAFFFRLRLQESDKHQT